LQSHKEEVKLFLTQNFIDILLISETHFTKKNYFSIPRYKLYYTNLSDGTAHGGTAMVIKETIERYELLKYEEDPIQATSIKMKGFPYEITITAVYCPPRHNLKEEHFETFFQTLGPKFIARGDYNSKQTLWGSRLTTTKDRELSTVSQEKNYSFLSTGTPIYWSTDENKIPHLLDFLVTNGISSAYTDRAILSTQITVRKPTPRLHNSKTNWDTYRQIIQDKVNLSIILKEHEYIKLETNNLLNLLQHAAKEATPNSDPQTQTNNISCEITKLVAEKRRARSIWERTHTPDSRRKYNRISNKLKSKLQEMRNESFKKYFSNLKTQNNSIWKTIEIKKNIKNLTPPPHANV